MTSVCILWLESAAVRGRVVFTMSGEGAADTNGRERKRLCVELDPLPTDRCRGGEQGAGARGVLLMRAGMNCECRRLQGKREREREEQEPKSWWMASRVTHSGCRPTSAHAYFVPHRASPEPSTEACARPLVFCEEIAHELRD